jgi:hypothetical protein
MSNATTPNEHDNAVRYVGNDSRGHVESHFLKATAPDADRALWIRHTVFVPRRRPELAVAELWGIAFDRRNGGSIAAAKNTRPIGDATYTAAPFRIVSPAATLETGRARGEITGGAHTLRWDLVFDAHGPPFHPFPVEGMYRAPFPKSKTLTPYPSTCFDGELIVDGQRWEIAHWPGMQGHNWGRHHADAYAWGHCNQWEDAPRGGAWFEGVSARVRMGPVLIPWLSVAALHVDDETIRFDGVRAMTSRSVGVGWYRWKFALEAARARLEGEISADRVDLAGLRYENPDGSMSYCLNSKLARGQLRLERKGHVPLELRSRAFALELGTRDPDHGIEMLV